VSFSKSDYFQCPPAKRGHFLCPVANFANLKIFLGSLDSQLS
jgi:hypothetical protein